ncbi:MAG: DUF6796 family protein [Myxococcota bacterium]
MSVPLHRLAGFAAIVGGVLNGVADFWLQGGLGVRPGVNTFAYLPQVPFEPVFVGSILGQAALPLWLLGFVPLYVALAPAGRWLALPPVLLFGYAFAIFPGYHGAYAFYSAAYQAQAAAPEAASAVLTTLVERNHRVHDAVMLMIGPAMTLGSLWFMTAVALGRTHYARWMVVFSPILVPLTQPLAEALPAPWGGYIRPAWGTTLFTLFFALATWVTWNVRDVREEPGSRPGGSR